MNRKVTLGVGFRLGVGTFFFHRTGCKALEQAAQESDGIAIPGNVLRTVWMWHLRVWFSGERSGCWLMVRLDDLRALFQPLQFHILFWSVYLIHLLLWCQKPVSSSALCPFLA